MRKIIGILLILSLLFVGCSNNTITDNKVQNQKYSFGPKVNENEVKKETKDKLQEYINNLGNPEKDDISFHGVSAKYNSEDSLEVVVFIRNGYNNPIWDIKSKVEIKIDNNTIASANFIFTKDEFGVLNSNESRVWTLVYKPESIKINNADLTEYILEYSSEHVQ